MNVIRVADPSSHSVVQAVGPEPQPGSEELLIRIHAAGITTTELSWYPTSHTPEGGPRAAAIPGHEFSGVVAAVGEKVGSMSVGQKVYGMNDWYLDGALAEYCITSYFAVAPKPVRLSHAEAASVPLGALTAWQGLFDHAKLQPGERVLIHGGAGGVGVYVVQLAHIQGAHVIATASKNNRDFLMGLGADEVIDYRTIRFEEQVSDIDVVFDAVGGETLQRSWSVLKPTGRLVTIASEASQAEDERVKKAFFIVEPNQMQLVKIAHLLDTGKMQPVVDSVIPLSEVPAAFAGTEPRHGRGKLVVAVVEDAK